MTNSNGKDEMPSLTVADLVKQVNNEAANSGMFILENHEGGSG